MFDFSAIFTSEVSFIPYRLLGMLVVCTVLGAGITLMLRLLGDMGPTYDGRNTVNPFAHLDWGGFLSGMLLRPGWVQSVKLRPQEIKGGAFGILLAVLVPLVVLLGLALLLEQLRPVFITLLDNSMQSTKLVLRAGFVAELFVWCAVINLIPLPPFLMGHLWAAWAPKLWQAYLAKAGWVSLVFLIIVLSGAWRPIFAPFVAPILDFIRI